ncbi:MAG: DegV family protein [Candidatus Izemoplasmatales bacterium]
MGKIGLLLDSTTITRDDILENEFIKVAPLGVSIDGVEYTEATLSKTQMAELLPHAKKMLTSQPAPGIFLELYQEFYNEGYTEVLVLTISEKLSGTFQSALIAKSMIDFPLDIRVHSCTVASFGVALGIPLIANMIKANTPFKKLDEETVRIYENSKVMFTLQDLMHLFKGGRLSKVSALIGTVLRIKPIVEMVEGKLELTKKERTNHGCFEYFMNQVDDHVNRFSNVYIDFIQMNRPDWETKFVDLMKEKYPTVQYHLTRAVSPVFSVHLGDQGFGVSILAYN